MFEKMKIVMSEVFNFLLPFIRQFLKAESKIIIAAAQNAVIKVAADPNMKDKDWSEKLSAAVSIAGAEIASKSVQAGTTQIINAIQAAYTKSQAS